MPRWLSRCSHSGIQIDRIHISTLGSFWYLVVCHNTPIVLKGSRKKTIIVPKEPGNLCRPLITVLKMLSHNLEFEDSLAYTKFQGSPSYITGSYLKKKINKSNLRQLI